MVDFTNIRMSGGVVGSSWNELLIYITLTLVFVALTLTIISNNNFVIVRRLSDPVMGRFGPVRSESVHIRKFSDIFNFVKLELNRKLPVILNRCRLIILAKFSPPYTPRMLKYIIPIFQKVTSFLKNKFLFLDSPVSKVTQNRCMVCDRETRARQKEIIKETNDLRVELLNSISSSSNIARSYLSAYLDRYETLNLAFFESWFLRCMHCQINNPFIFPSFYRLWHEIRGVYFPDFKTATTNSKNNPFQLSCRDCLMITLSFQCRLIAQMKSMIQHANSRNDFLEIQKYIDEMTNILQSPSTIEYCENCCHPFDKTLSRWIVFVPDFFSSNNDPPSDSVYARI